jgi:predicted esterase
MIALLVAAALAQTKDGITEGQAKNGLTYCVRVPKTYDARAGAPAILWLHGSNMSAIDYVQGSFVGMKWFPDWILVGIDGETGTKERGHNYTEDSAKLLVEAYDEITSKLKVTKAFVGGHSQGAFVTFSIVMEHPGKFAGAIPVAGGLWMQCEPERYKPEQLEAQKRTALAIVHGRADPVVEFSMSENAHFSYVDAAFPMVRLFDPKEGDHRFIFLPVREAIEWCDAVTQTDAKKLQPASALLLKEEDWRGASHASRASKATAISKQVETAAAARAKTLAKEMAKPGDAWVLDFFDFRAKFGLTDAARPLLAAYDRLRADHDRPAGQLFWAARDDFNGGRKDAGYRKYEEIVAKHFGSRWYWYAKRSLNNRK